MTLYRWVLVAGVLLACGSASREGPSNDGSGGAGNGAKLSADAFCEAWFDVAVGFLERCLPGNADWSLLLQGSQSCAELKSSIDAGKVRYDADTGAECLRRVPTQACEELFEGEVQTLCAALVGQLPPGAACNPNTSECAGGFCLSSPAGTCGSFCKELVKKGGECSSSEPCEINLACVDGVCTALPRKGEACLGEEHQCQGRAFCEGGNTSEPGTCVLRKSENEACVDRNDCLSQRCVDGVCLKRKPVGADCAVGENECLVPAQCVDGKCTARAAETGEPCSEFGDKEILRCADGLYCDRSAKVCQPLKSPGQPCVNALECQGDNPLCQNKVCVACSEP